jgi:hypothetical protein
MAIWYILRQFGNLGFFSGHLVYFPPFWYIVSRKIWQPWQQLEANGEMKQIGLGRDEESHK